MMWDFKFHLLIWKRIFKSNLP